MTIRFIQLGLAGIALFSGCHPPSPPPFDPAAYESPAAAAVLRQVMADAADARRQAKVGVIVLGDRLHDATPAFREQLTTPGLQWFAGTDMTQVWIGPIARVVEKQSKLQPLQLQIVSVFRRDDGAEEVVAAWAFEDRMVRRRYLARPGNDGQWEIQPMEIIEQKPSPSL